MKKLSTALSALLLAGFVCAQQQPLFYESFDKCLNDDFYDGFTGGNDDLWGGNIATEIAVFTDNEGWSFDNVFGANQCVKLGTSDNLQGRAKTPSIACTGDATLTFRAAPWNEEKNFSVTVSVSGGTADKSVFELDKHWNDLTVHITDITSAVTITFSTGTKKQRIFLDEVKLIPAASDAPAIRVAEGNSIDFGMVGYNYSALKREVTVKGENLSAKGITVGIEEDADHLFSVSPSSLPAEGGVLTVTCKSGASSTMHGAWLVLRAEGAAEGAQQVEKKVSMAVEVIDLALEGSGTKEDPYTVSDALLIISNNYFWENTLYWVSGYVLGGVKRYQDKFDGLSTTDNLSLVLADDAAENNMNRILTVQLNSGPARDNLNVADNPELIGQRVSVQGSFDTYLGKPGVKGVMTEEQYVRPDRDNTAVEDLPALDPEAPAYDVLGRQVNADHKGIVIQNGRKYLVR